MQRYEKSISTSKIKYTFIGASMILIGGLVAAWFDNPSYGLLPLLVGPFCAGLVWFGIVLIVLAVKPLFKRT